MANTEQEQSGRGIVEVLIIIAFIAVVAGVGWSVYEHVRQTATTITTASSKNQIIKTQSGNKGDSQPEASAYEIPELGVELTLPDSLKDLKYVIDTSSVAGTTFVRFTTTTLESQDGASSLCTAANSALGVMWKLDRDPIAAGASASTSKKIGNTYLLYEHPQQGCSYSHSTNELLTSQAQLLEEAVQTARAI